MSGNTNPIFSRVGSVQGGALLQTASALDSGGVGVNVIPVFTADPTNGSFIQRLRFKAAVGAASVATVARIWVNEGILNQASTVTAPGIPSGTTSTTGGSMIFGSFYAKVQAVDQWGGLSTASAETATAITISSAGTTNSITWNWSASSGAANYRLYVGPAAGGEYSYFTTNTNSFVQTVAVISGQVSSPLDNVVNNMLVGEVSLPAITTSTSAANVDVDYPLNFALPPGYRVMVGLGTTVVGGWYVTGIGGNY